MAQIGIVQAVEQLAQCSGTNFKTLYAAVAKIGDFADLDAAFAAGADGEINTVVEALNTLQGMIPTVRTNEEITTLANTAIQTWVSNAPAAFDTLLEIGTYLTNNSDVRDSILQSLAKRVAVDQVQNFTTEEKAQGRANIDAASTAEVNLAITTAVSQASTYADEQLAPVSDQVDTNTDLLAVLAAQYQPAQALQTLAVKDNTTTLVTGYLADTAGASYAGDAPAGTQVAYAIRDAAFELKTMPDDVSFNFADKGVLEMHVNGTKVDEYDLEAAFDATKRTGTQTYAPVSGAAGKLTVLSVGVYQTLYQRGTAKVAISSGDLVSGYNTIEVKHTGIANPQTTATFKVWWDNSGATPSVANQSLTMLDDGGASAVYRSGVKYGGIGSVVELNADVVNVAKNVYKQVPLDVTGMNVVANTTIAITDASVTGLSTPPVSTETMNVGGKQLTLNVAGKATLNMLASLTASTPFATASAVSTPSANIMAWTDNAASSDTLETFSDESRRMPTATDLTAAALATAAIVGQWNSQTALSEGEAMVGVASENVTALMRAKGDFTAKVPANTANYSAFTADGVYKRVFLSPGARGNCQIKLYGVTSVGAFGAGDVNVRLAVPGQTAMLDVGTYEDVSVAASVENAGALAAVPAVAGGNVTLTASFKGKSTSASSNRIGVEVTIRNSTVAITAIEVIWS